MKKISCVVMVDYYHKYMKTSLNITSKYNHIYLLGNSKFKSFESKNITFVDIENYNNLDSQFNIYEPDKDDIIILAFAYLGKTGFENNFPVSLEGQNQKKVFFHPTTNFC